MYFSLPHKKLYKVLSSIGVCILLIGGITNSRVGVAGDMKFTKKPLTMLGT